MAAATSVNISALKDALTPKVIKTTQVEALATLKVKCKVPGKSGTHQFDVRKLVDEKRCDIQEELSSGNYFIPKEFSHKSVFERFGQGFESSRIEFQRRKAKLDLADVEDSKRYWEFQTALTGSSKEKVIYDVNRASKTAAKFSHIMNISYAHTSKLIKNGPTGGELDSLKIRADLHLQHIEIKSNLISAVIEKSTKQLKKGEACVRAVIGSFKAALATEVTLHPYIYFGSYKTRKELKKDIDSVVRGLDEQSQKRLLCQEDLEDMRLDKLLPHVGTIYTEDYEQLVSIFHCSYLLEPVSMTGSVADWSKALVGREGLSLGVTDQPTPTDPHKFGTIIQTPLSCDHAMLFWTPDQVALIRNLQNLSLIFTGPFGSGKTQILRAMRELMEKDPSIAKVYMISGLEWKTYGSELLSSVFILDILTGATTATDIRRELGSTEEEFWKLVPKYIQHKLDSETGNLTFLIDEAPMIFRDSDLESWRDNWKTVTNSNRAIIRIAIRPDCYSEFNAMDEKNLLGGLTPVLLNKVLRNTSTIVETAGGVAASRSNFPVEETTVSNIVGTRPILYIVEEEKHRLPVGVIAAYREHETDLDPGVILCEDSDQVLETKQVLQGMGVTVTVFTGGREVGNSAYAYIKAFFKSPSGVLITTGDCFSGMDSSCVLATDLNLDAEFGQTGESQLPYRAVSKLILVATRWETGKMESDRNLGMWELRDAHNTLNNRKIHNLAQFDKNAYQRQIVKQVKKIQDQGSRIQQLQQQQTAGPNTELECEKQILKIMQEIQQQMGKIQALHQQQAIDYTEEREQEVRKAEEMLEGMQEIQQHTGTIQALQEQQVTDYTEEREEEIRKDKKMLQWMSKIQQQMRKIQALHNQQVLDYTLEREEEIREAEEMLQVIQEIHQQNKKIQPQIKKMKSLHQQQVTDYSRERKQEIKREEDILQVMQKIQQQMVKIQSQHQQLATNRTEEQEVQLKEEKKYLLEMKVVEKKTLINILEQQHRQIQQKIEWENQQLEALLQVGDDEPPPYCE